MKTVCTAYAIDPYKGSEDGMGWNFINQIAKNHKVFAITRKNNRGNIEKYMAEKPSELYQNINFLYFDLPYYLRFWKKGGRGAMLYYFLWQLTVILFIKKQKLDFDLVHNLNFHNDWTPSMLWMLGKPMVWGPIGHHPKIPKTFIKEYGIRVYLKDRMAWMVKNIFWNMGLLLKITAKKAELIFAMNSDVAKRLRLDESKVLLMPSVASDDEVFVRRDINKSMHILSAGRFVALKGFDVTIRAFAHFYQSLAVADKKHVSLTLVGDGPEKQRLMRIAKNEGVLDQVRFINWLPREELKVLYKSSDAFLFPSHEGAGMVVAEAMSYSLPVLCFENSGPGEFVDHSCGLKIAYGDYTQTITHFSEALSKLYFDLEFRKSLSSGAAKHYENNFKWDLRGKQIDNAYKSIFKQKTVQQKTIVGVHLLNDFSGSPLVFKQALEGLAKKGHNVDLYTSFKHEGFLSIVVGAKNKNINYRRSNSKWMTLLFLLLNQGILFFKMLKYWNKEVVFYINTILPFGAALAAKLMRKKVVYHVHETSLRPLVFKQFLFWVLRKTASESIYVSNYLKENEGIKATRMHTVYNALSEDFTEKALLHRPSPNGSFNVLMLCSLRDYKGVREFWGLAAKIPSANFELVLNANLEEIEVFFGLQQKPSNLKLFSAQKNVHPFFRRAHLVLNLSHPDKWIETFGMTALEANSYSLPVIVPTVGGIAEIVDEGVNGFKIDVSETHQLIQQINALKTQPGEYKKLSMSSSEHARKFSIHEMENKIAAILN
jgi:glycosyltransferase involved in cell wall biosynthesis